MNDPERQTPPIDWTYNANGHTGMIPQASEEEAMALIDGRPAVLVGYSFDFDARAIKYRALYLP
ncbi:hypothetical protein [Sphingomonas sp. SRS2]|uniref:hypothetical protein n=1 Tax=Sphingomonas sp. SRS2 TaxID=133190 RepID=UPI0006184B78|nr:hypothetical protein [Sphingomonas sp. SRS2]KKC24899.1 hypothetical protein WP12_16865 [Sphingomonas sp. SRS2]